MVPHDGERGVDTLPPGDARTQPQFGIVGIGEKIFVEAADLVEHLAAVHGGAAVRPQRGLHAIELSDVQRTGAAPSVLAIGPDQVPGFVDAPRIGSHQNFGRRHADVRAIFKDGVECRQPVGIRLGVVIQERDEFAGRGGDALVISRAKAAVDGVANQRRLGKFLLDALD